MEQSFIVRTSALAICLVLLLGMILFFIIGRLVRRRWRLQDYEAKGGVGMIQTAVLGLFGFILAFTFGMSANRFDYVRNAFIDESNAMSTAIYRSDLYSDSIRQLFMENFRNFVEARISLYEHREDLALVRIDIGKAQLAQQNLWDLAMYQSKQPNMLIPSNQMIPALNNLFDSASKRDTLLKSPIPEAIVIMLLILAITSSFLTGISTHEIGKRERLIIICYIIFTSVVTYITIDLSRPLRGIIKPVAGVNAIKEVREMLK